MTRNGPYFQDLDGDTGIIGPGVNANAPGGCALYDAWEKAIFEAVTDECGTDETANATIEAARDELIPLMNLAYAEGVKAR